MIVNRQTDASTLDRLASRLKSTSDKYYMPSLAADLAKLVICIKLL